ncbi:MAG: hypothetical protein ACLVCQ_04210, partial [Subdoligranulum sp.]
YLRFWLSICRTSLAVSALKIMRYCLKYYFIYYRGLYDGAQENLHQTGKKTLAFGNKSDV